MSRDRNEGGKNTGRLEPRALLREGCRRGRKRQVRAGVVRRGHLTKPGQPNTELVFWKGAVGGRGPADTQGRGSARHRQSDADMAGVAVQVRANEGLQPGMHVKGRHNTGRCWRTNHTTVVLIMFKGATATAVSKATQASWDTAPQPVRPRSAPTLFSLLPGSCSLSLQRAYHCLMLYYECT